MQTLISHIKHFLFPSFCASCKLFFHADESVLCNECFQKIRPVVSRELAITATKKITVHAVGAYDQPLVSLILAKSSGNRTVAHQLGELVWQRSVLEYLPFDYIVPIPLHWTRYAWRGYNQADEIARVISNHSEKPIADLLKRTRRTPFQSSFQGDDRIANVKDVFQLQVEDRALYEDKHILLVDDVMTSGATLSQAARELYKLKPAKITAIVIARVA